MSSRSGKQRRSGPRRASQSSPASPGDSYYPTQWSEWDWVETTGRYQRYRLSGPSRYEYENYDPQSNDEPRGAVPLDSIPEGSKAYTSQLNYTTSPVDAVADKVSNITLESSLGTHEDPQAGSVAEDQPSSESGNPPADEDEPEPISPQYGSQGHISTESAPDSYTQPDDQNTAIGGRSPINSAAQPMSRFAGTAYAASVTSSTSYFPISYSKTPSSSAYPSFTSTPISNPSFVPNTVGGGQISYSNQQYTPPYQTPASQYPSQEQRKYRHPSPHIRPSNQNTSEDQDPSFKVHQAWEFKWGRVFKILWTEPCGQTQDGSDANASMSVGTYTIQKGQDGKKFHQKIRRFVIINSMEGHCICLPINTYRGQGVNKKGVKASHHTIIYTDPQPVEYAGERKKGLKKEPIRMKPSNPRHRLDKASRLNYAKTYTVEYNVKVCFIGQIHPNSEWQLSTDFDQMHPPIARGKPPVKASTSYQVSFAGGPAQMEGPEEPPNDPQHFDDERSESDENDEEPSNNNDLYSSD